MAALGQIVRAGLGRFERPVVELYRSAFIDLAALATLLRSVAEPKCILEVGCGDGQLSTQLVSTFPTAKLLGIDIASEPGRLFQGDRERASFRSVPVAELRAEGPVPFDLVVLCDVLHHVPPGGRDGLLRDAFELTARSGLFVVKEWERRRNLAHSLAYVSDRYLTGDRVVFLSETELRTQLRRLFPDAQMALDARIPPRRNNLILGLRSG